MSGQSRPTAHLETALGYYINPLVNVVLGAVFLGERFNGCRLSPSPCAVIAVTILTVKAGGLPWVSLALAFSFGFYGFLRKTLADRPDPGLHAGSPAAVDPGACDHRLGGSAWHRSFRPDRATDIGLLMLAGPVTAFR
jgi:chloramphenicol-sensitive protein RarD